MGKPSRIRRRWQAARQPQLYDEPFVIVKGGRVVWWLATYRFLRGPRERD